MAAHSVLAALLLVALTACGGTPPVMRLALLAPFEGRYREVGYQALYAARLAQIGRASCRERVLVKV